MLASLKFPFAFILTAIVVALDVNYVK